MIKDKDVRINRDLLRWILLGVGVVALLVALIAAIVIGVDPNKTVLYIALAVGALGIVGFVLIDPESISKALTGRTGQQATISLLMTIFTLTAIVVLFSLVYKLDQDGTISPWDVGKSGQYQLHQQTIDILNSLEEPVHITGFYSSGTSDDAELLLKQYRGNSNGKLTFDIVDPDKDPGEAARLGATRSGMLVFEQGDRTAQATFADESALTGALVKVVLGEPQKAYLLTGHGERSVDDFANQGFSQAQSQLDRANYSLEPLNLIESGSIPADAATVIIAGPTAQLSQPEIDALTAYLDGGGSVLVLSDPGAGGGSLGNGVLGAAYSSDGRLLATAGADGTAKIWDAQTGQERMSLRGHTSDVIDVAFSPNEQKLVTAGRDGTVRVWDLTNGQEITELQGQTGLVQRVEWSPDGSTIASAGQDQVVNVWDAETFEPMSYSPLTTASPLLAVAYSPDGSLIAAGGGRTQGAVDGSVYVWNVADGSEVANRTLHTNPVFAIAFTPDGSELKSAAIDGTLGTLDVATGDGNTETLYPDVGITGLGFLQDGTQVLALGDGSVHIRPAGSTSTTDDTVLTGHTDLIWKLVVRPGDEEFTTVSRDGDARVWNIADGDTRLRLQAHNTGDPLLTYLDTAWGIKVGDDLVVDQATAQLFDAVTPVIFTYSATSPITKPLNDAQERTFFILARSVQAQATPPDGITDTALMFTSSGAAGTSWAETTDPFGTNQVSFDEQDIPGPVSIAVSGENAATQGRVVVIGDADFASNQALQSTTYANGQLLINTLNWLTQNENGIDIPPADLGTATWDRPLSAAPMAILQIGATCLLPLIFLVIGAVVWFIRRRRR